jgi:hypothetical protein
MNVICSFFAACPCLHISDINGEEMSIYKSNKNKISGAMMLPANA